MTIPYKLVDLTHPLTTSTPSWDNSCGFNHTTSLDYADCTSEVKFRVQGINMPAGIGTHMDAPAHCDSQGKTIDALSLQDCLAPCVVIDISAKAHETYLCSIQDIWISKNNIDLSSLVILSLLHWMVALLVNACAIPE
jgi:kynurenine formamidase